MSQNRNQRGRNDRDEDGNQGGWNLPALVGGVVGGIAAIAGGLYWYSRTNNSHQQEPASPAATTRRVSDTRQRTSSLQSGTRNRTSRESSNSSQGMSDLLSNLMQGLSTGNSAGESSRRGVPRSSIPKKPKITNLNGLINDIYLRYIALNDEDFENYYGVMHQIWLELHNKMKEVDPYYRKYSSKVQFAGSHSDRLRINKPDEFDIDIVIGLPLCSKVHPLNPAESDFIIEPKEPGFIQLKTGVQLERLPYRDGQEWQNNKAAYEWRDDRNYILRSKFMDWFKSVVNKALNEFPSIGGVPIFYLDGVAYRIQKSGSGPAMTLYVENLERGFKLDVDLVPALRFPIGRWPVCTGYRAIPPRARGIEDWMVVPKPKKAGHTKHDRNRSWRVALHEHEAMIMHDTNHMRQAIRLIKKLRDSQGMNKIASYYIKTLFFWEAMEKERQFWNTNPVELFKHMLKKFHTALVEGNIPYFWNRGNNLIGGVDRGTLNRYANTVGELLQILDQPAEYKTVAKYLLTRDEYKEYEKLL